MALPLLPIASGAVKLGRKIFGGIKKRQARRKEKREARDQKQNAKLQGLENLLGGGGGGGATSAVQQGNMGFISNLVERSKVFEDPIKVKFGGLPVDIAEDADEVRENRLLAGSPGMNNNTMLLIGAALVAFLFLGRKR